jgi:predicted hydrocarbon binding protein
MLKKTRSSEHDILLEDVTVPSFGFELLREELLPTILGKDAPEILYWAGKQLARSNHLQDLTDISSFFEKAGWGSLTIKKESKSELLFELTSPLIQRRLELKQETHYKLEAGFLAQQIETQIGMITEAYEQIQKKSRLVEITVRWDQKDIVSN